MPEQDYDYSLDNNFKNEVYDAQGPTESQEYTI
jgi:hypothetical protein